MKIAPIDHRIHQMKIGQVPLEYGDVPFIRYNQHDNNIDCQAKSLNLNSVSNLPQKLPPNINVAKQDESMNDMNYNTSLSHERFKNNFLTGQSDDYQREFMRSIP